MAARKKQAAKSPAPAAKSSAKKAASSAVKPANAKVSPDKVAKATTPSKKQFRFSWSKKHPGAETIKIELDEASANYLRESDHKAKTTSASKSDTGRSATASPTRQLLFGLKRSPPEKEENDTNEAGEPDPYEEDGYEAYDSDEEEAWEEETDYEEGEEEDTIEEGGGPKTPRKRKSLVKFPIDVKPLTPGGEVIGPDHPSVPHSANNMERYLLRQSRGMGKHDPNGRYHGRTLVHWHRPRMMEKLLVFLLYECHQRSVPIPWDHIVHRLQPGSSGPSAVQYIEKMRYKLIAEGHIVPPTKTKPYLPMDDNVRALVRADPNGPPGKVRIVRWDEHIEHLKKSLDNPGISNGSGRYRRGPDGRRSRAGARRDEPQLKVEYPEEYLASAKAIADSVSAAKTKARRQRAKDKKRKRMEQSQSDAEERGEVADPSDLTEDSEYVPVAKKTRTRRSTRKSRSKVETRDEVEVAHTTYAVMQFGSKDEVTSNGTSSLPIKLSISSEKLASFPPGHSGSPAPESQNDDTEDDDAEEGGAEEGDDDAEDDDASDPELREDFETSPEHGESDEDEEKDGEVEDEDHMEAEQGAVEYGGINEHGTLEDYYSRQNNGFEPDHEDDVFGGLHPYGMDQQTPWNQFPAAASSNPQASGYMSTSQFASPQQDDYHMNGRFDHENQAQVAAQHTGMTYHQPENDFSVYEDEEQHSGMLEWPGNLTPQVRHGDFFDEQDENAPPGLASPPGYYGYGYEDPFRDPYYQQ